MKKLFLFIILIIITIPLVLAYNCNIACLKQGYVFGKCTIVSPYFVKIPGGDDCSKRGSATLSIGSTAVDTFENAEAYIGENKTDPNWVWIVSGLESKAVTAISNTDDDTQHSGAIMGIKNDFLADGIDDEDVKAITMNEEYCMPKNYICVKLNATNTNDYASYTISKTVADLSAWNKSWTAKDTILIQSTGLEDGLNTQIAGYDIASITADVKTDKIWLAYNNTESYITIVYEKSDATKDIAGYVLMDDTSDDKNVADVNYINTQNDKVQIDLRGDSNTANNLDLVLDITGTDGAVATEGADDITMNLKHTANDDLKGFGTEAGNAEEADLIWVSTNIGKKEVGMRSLYGIVIEAPKENLDTDKVKLKIPSTQLKVNVVISGESTTKESSFEEALNETEKMPEPVLSNQVTNKENYNLILIGSPCINPLIESFPDFPKCKEWNLKPGEAIIKLTSNADKTAMLIAGATNEDTKNAIEILNNSKKYNLEGTYVKIVNDVITPLIKETRYLDLSDFPTPYIKDGKFQDLMIVAGEKASPDEIFTVSILSNDLFEKTREKFRVYNATTTSTVTEMISYNIPLGTSIISSKYFGEHLTDNDISTLQESKLNFGGEEYHFHDEIMFYQDGPTIETSLSSQDFTYGSDIYMELLQSRMRYYYVLDDKIDLTTISASKPLEIKFMNNFLSITDVDPTKLVSQIAKEYTMEAGDSVKVNSIGFKLVNVNKQGAILVEVNNTSAIIPEGTNKIVSGLDIKNLAGFEQESSGCCCYDLFSYLAG